MEIGEQAIQIAFLQTISDFDSSITSQFPIIRKRMSSSSYCTLRKWQGEEKEIDLRFVIAQKGANGVVITVYLFAIWELAQNNTYNV